MNPLLAEPDGMLYCQPSGNYMVVVLKIGDRLRLMSLDVLNPQMNLAQSQLLLLSPLHLLETYTRAMLLALLWSYPPQRVGMIGLGGGRLAVVLHHYFPQVVVEAVELDPAVVVAARHFFGVPQDSRLRVVVGEGRAFLAQRPLAGYDYLLIDAFDAMGHTPYSLLTQEFYQLCHTHLAARGVLVINVLNDEPLYWERISTLQTVFSHVAFCPMAQGNTILFASETPLPPIAEVVRRTAVLQDRYGFSFPITDYAPLLQIIPADLQKIILHDEPTPIDNLP